MRDGKTYDPSSACGRAEFVVSLAGPPLSSVSSESLELEPA